MNLCEIRKVADIAAVPMFILLIYYITVNKRLEKKEREYTRVEKLILFFAIVGLIADVTFSLEYFFFNQKC